MFWHLKHSLLISYRPMVLFTLNQIWFAIFTHHHIYAPLICSTYSVPAQADSLTELHSYLRVLRINNASINKIINKIMLYSLVTEQNHRKSHSLFRSPEGLNSPGEWEQACCQFCNRSGSVDSNPRAESLFPSHSALAFHKAQVT